MARPKDKRAKDAKPGRKLARGVTDDPSTYVVETLQQFKVLAHPLRQRMLERFAAGRRTTKQVADELGEKPTRLYHHVAALERAGLIHLVETRPKRGTTEKYYERVAERLAIDPTLFAGQVPAGTIENASLGVLDGLLHNMRQELISLMAQTGSALEELDGLLLHVEVRGSEAKMKRIQERLQALVEELESEDESDGDESPEQAQRLVLGWYPLKDGD